MAQITKLESQEALDAAFTESQDQTVVLFKHSLICPTSSRAFDVFQSFVSDQLDERASFKLIEIQRQRALSREVEQRTEVKHESPQVLVLQDGQVIWHDSHWRITAEALEDAVPTAVASS
ncbi:MAG: bacillithiol system redox-active protein YtxJ [Thermoanaerobaculia bacterium]|nr:bacillithiol system redox-active protein YtxJ [Thermoanaerobaculia bacterium]